MTTLIMPGTRPPFVALRGRFFRMVASGHADAALAGSRTAGRYSRAGMPALYLSASVAGVAAAMQAHPAIDDLERQILGFDVEADLIADLRDAAACAVLGVSLEAAQAPWQAVVARGDAPTSWTVADSLRNLGANGLIDPSRRAAGLWHLTLFRWNVPGAPQILPAPVDL
jgi:RES domain-containing protein